MTDYAFVKREREAEPGGLLPLLPVQKVASYVDEHC
jgi:hypothetical protein